MFIYNLKLNSSILFKILLGFIIAIVICLYIYNVKKIENVAIKHNKQYEEYCNKEILGTELISLINKAIDYNEKNSVAKQENTIYYINNNTNSIQITVKFLDNDKIIESELTSLRPSIVINKNLNVTGNGTYGDPYKLN